MDHAQGRTILLAVERKIGIERQDRVAGMDFRHLNDGSHRRATSEYPDISNSSMRPVVPE